MKPEQKIQQEIFVYWHNNNPNSIIHSVPNGFGLNIPPIVPERFHAVIRKAIAMAIDLLKLTGMVEGIADLIIWLPNSRAIMVEVKTEKGKQRPGQKKIESKMQAIGGIYILVRSLEDFQQQIKNYL
jgi:hypothetical protein